MTIRNILLIGILSFVLAACSSDPLKVDASEIKVNTRFVNLDSSIVHSDPQQLIRNHHGFKVQIKDIYDYQLGHCLQIGKISDTAFVRSIRQFVNDPAISRIEKEIGSQFKDLSPIQTNIIEGLQHLKYHFPSGKIPSHVVFMNSLFQANAFCTENEIGIGLERYLGKETNVIKELPSEPFYDWIKEGMNKDFLERDALCAWIMTHYVEEVEGNLAENIVRWGKILYLTEASFPAVDDHIIIRYNAADLTWAKNNLKHFWEYLVHEEMLFKINELNNSNLLKDAPFTIGLSEESPDRMGQYLGWQMVRHYMNHNEVSLEELLKVPFNTILQEFEIEE